MTEAPDTIHGRMKEGAHIAGYSLSRAMESLRYLLEDKRYEQLAPGYSNVNEFLRDTKEAFKLLRIDPEERKQIAEMVKELQPQSSQRAIADMVGSSHPTIAKDLDENSGKNLPEEPQKEKNSGKNLPSQPAIPPDDYDPVEDVEKERKKEQRKQQRKKEIEQLKKEIETGEHNLPDGKFEVIAVDPPWPYGTKYDPEGRRAANPYPEMSLEEIKNIELPEADDCVLWLWTTHKFMRHAFNIIDHWGYEDKAILTWVKDRMGLGHWLRSQSEFCIMAVKGKPIIELTNQTTVLNAPMREHSRKPDKFYKMVEKLCIGRKLDYFSREEREGWEVYGVEERF